MKLENLSKNDFDLTGKNLRGYRCKICDKSVSNAAYHVLIGIPHVICNDCYKELPNE